MTQPNEIIKKLDELVKQWKGIREMTTPNPMRDGEIFYSDCAALLLAHADTIREWGEAIGDTGAPTELEEAGFSLSIWAASIRWRDGDNTQDWLDGLRERIETVQRLYNGKVADAALAANSGRRGE